MKRAPLTLGLCGLALAAAACKPNLGAPQSLVVGPTILAVRGLPPEASAGATVTYDALTVDVTGTVASPAIGWAQCLAIDPPANGNDVSDDCLTGPDDTTMPSPTFTAALSMDACTLFGPETPPPVKGQPPRRPADPDTTGGYYQPVRATWQSDAGLLLAFGFERITCPLANAPTDIAGQFASTYLPNENPALADLQLISPSGNATPLYTAGQATAATSAAGQRVTLEADFSPDSAETFPVWNVVTLTLQMKRESLRVSWFATAGAFEHDVTGRSETETETETFTQNAWTAPTTPGPVHLWAVLRDDRGGVDFAAAEIDVTP